MSELPDNVLQIIKKHCLLGDDAQNRNAYQEAIDHYNEGFALVPEPYQDWEAPTWILVAIGDAYFFMSDFSQAAEYMKAAIQCPDGLGNPFIHLRLGQAQFELKNEVRAKDELMRAYMGGGEEIFAGEDPKYWIFVESITN